MAKKIKKISLLPPELKEREKGQQRQRMVAALSMLVAIALVFGLTIMLFINLGNRSALRGLEDQRAATEAEIASLQEYVELNERINRLEGIVLKIMGSPPEWHALLRNIGYKVPGDVWLTSFNVSNMMAHDPFVEEYTADDHVSDDGDDVNGDASEQQIEEPVVMEAGELLIMGGAVYHYSVSRMINLMRETEGLNSIRCSYSNLQDGVVQFEIKAKIDTGPRYEFPEHYYLDGGPETQPDPDGVPEEDADSPEVEEESLPSPDNEV